MFPHDFSLKEKFLRFDLFVVSLLLLFLFFSPWFYGLTRFFDQLAAQIFIFLFFFIVSLKSPFSRPHLTSESLETWLLAGAALGFVFCIFSVLPYRSFTLWLRFLSLILFYFLIRHQIRGLERFKKMLGVIAACGVFYSIYDFFQIYGLFRRDFWYVGFPASRYVNGGHFAVFLLFPLFAAIILTLLNRKFWTRLLAFAGVTIMLSALALSRSRAGWLAFVAGFLFFCASLSKARLNFPSGKFSVRMTAFLALGFGVLIWAGRSVFLTRFQELWNIPGAHFYGFIFRVNVWKASLLAIGARPWGWGLGTFCEVFPRYKLHEDRFLIDYAHNEFLQVGVDLGLSGILFLAGFIFFYFRRIFRLLTDQKEFSLKVAGAAFGATASGFILTSLVDFPLRIYATGFFLAAFLALSSFLFERGTEADLQKKMLPAQSRDSVRVLAKPLRFFLLAVIFSVAFFSSIQLFAQKSFETAQTLEKQFKWDRAEAFYGKALSFMPLEGHYPGAFAGLIEKRMALSMQSASREKFRRQAIALYERAQRLEPFTARYDYSLARLYEAEGRIPEAAAAFQKAMVLEPLNSYFICEYGFFAARHLELREALQAFEKYQTLTFKEGTRGTPCEILNALAKRTQSYQDLRRAIPDTVEAHRCLGQVLAGSQQWELVKKEFDIAFEMAQHTMLSFEEFAASREPLAEFYVLNGRKAEALEIYRKSLEFYPGDVYAQGKIRELSFNSSESAKTL